MTQKEIDACRKAAEKLSKKALWSEFIKYYDEAYDIALRKAQERQRLPQDRLLQDPLCRG